MIVKQFNENPIQDIAHKRMIISRKKNFDLNNHEDSFIQDIFRQHLQIGV
jgi:hypothetical protein